jgi:hypothetical protein
VILWADGGHVTIEPESVEERDALQKLETYVGQRLAHFKGAHLTRETLAEMRAAINEVLAEARARRLT